MFHSYGNNSWPLRVNFTALLKIDDFSTDSFSLSSTMDFAQYNLTPAEMGIDVAFQEKFETVAPLLTAHAEAILVTRECCQALRSWKGGRTKTEFYKEYQRLKNLYEDAERSQLKTHAALQVALMGEEAWLELKRLEKEKADEEYEQALQDDLDATFD